MKVSNLILFASILFVSSQAFAEVKLIKKSELNSTEREVTQHRYDSQINQMNNDSASLADRILNREKYLAQNKNNSGSDFQVKLIKK